MSLLEPDNQTIFRNYGKHSNLPKTTAITKTKTRGKIKQQQQHQQQIHNNKHNNNNNNSKMLDLPEAQFPLEVPPLEAHSDAV